MLDLFILLWTMLMVENYTS